MASKKVSDIVKDVRIVLDQNSADLKLTSLSDIDTLELDEIIKKSIISAVQLVHCIAPLPKLEGVSFSSESVEWEGEEGYGYGIVTLPSDFMRLVSFRMSDWKRSVSRLIEEDSQEYSKQLSKYWGIKGSPDKPVCAYIHESGLKRLQFFSSNMGKVTVVEVHHTEDDPDTAGFNETGYTSTTSIPNVGCATINTALYVGKPEIKTEGTYEVVNISPLCYEAAIYSCASIVASTLGSNTNQFLDKIAEGLLK